MSLSPTHTVYFVGSFNSSSKEVNAATATARSKVRASSPEHPAHALITLYHGTCDRSPSSLPTYDSREWSFFLRCTPSRPRREKRRRAVAGTEPGSPSPPLQLIRRPACSATHTQAARPLPPSPITHLGQVMLPLSLFTARREQEPTRIATVCVMEKH